MRNVNNWLIAAGVLIVIAYLWGVLNGSLARGTFAHQQIVAVGTGIWIATVVRLMLRRAAIEPHH